MVVLKLIMNVKFSMNVNCITVNVLSIFIVVIFVVVVVVVIIIVIGIPLQLHTGCRLLITSLSSVHRACQNSYSW